jgi:hypothetical protein
MIYGLDLLGGRRMTLRAFWRAALLILALALLTAGCRTSFQEWNNDMANQTGRHESSYKAEKQAKHSYSIFP